MHEFLLNPQRRSVAEVEGAPPGAAVILFRSNEPGDSTILGSNLCIDPAGAERVGAVTQASAVGTATFQPVPNGRLPNFGGIASADYLQAVVLGANQSLTNSVAWLPWSTHPEWDYARHQHIIVKRW